MSKYSLIAYSDDIKFKISMMEYDNKENIGIYKKDVNLVTIDYNTSFFENDVELLSYLTRNQKISFVPKGFYIEDGKKRLPLVFKNNKELSYFALYKNTNISSTFLIISSKITLFPFNNM